MDLHDPVTSIKGVGDAVAKKMQQLKLATVEDVIYNFPRTYNDYSVIKNINKIRPGMVTVKAKIKQVKGRYVRRGMHITEAVASDSTSSVRIVWFNQPYRAQSIDSNATYFLSGEFGHHGRHLSITNPAIEAEKDLQLHTGRIVPVYKQTKGLTSSKLRTIVEGCRGVIATLPDDFPASLIGVYTSMTHAEAVAAMHFPESMEQLAEAKRRLGFEEVFDLALAAELNRQQNKLNKSLRIQFNRSAAKQFVAKLPFKLTGAQRKAAWQTLQDMDSYTPTNRMLEGDVGSGKTVVAAMASFMAMRNGLQTAIMAPTEVLARQLHTTLATIFKPHDLNYEVGLLLGSQDKSTKQLVRRQIANKEKHIVVGTHALIQEDVNMHSLGLVVIDEQHRFGVKQREALLQKAGHMPHVITMTATPIPRSLALTLYGELDISVISEKPVGRLPVKTVICSPNSRKQLHKAVNDRLQASEQVFIVCPLISESDDLPIRSVEEVFTEAKNAYKNHTVRLLHGKLKSKVKESTMQQFIEGKIDVLVSTTVIEVGVDVPNATVMVIESAERFGLAQLHQLRGRVGRSNKQSWCYLMLSNSAAPPKRLRALQSTNDGFKLAELDLTLRGPGAIYGHTQHGELDLRIAQLTDVALIATAKQSAKTCIRMGDKLIQYDRLTKRAQKYRAVTNLN